MLIFIHIWIEFVRKVEHIADSSYNYKEQPIFFSSICVSAEDHFADFILENILLLG